MGGTASVLDDHPDRPVLRPHSLDATGGRGMQVIDTLATAWGVRSHPTGEAVWFILIDQKAGALAGHLEVDDAAEHQV